MAQAQRRCLLRSLEPGIADEIENGEVEKMADFYEAYNTKLTKASECAAIAMRDLCVAKMYEYAVNYTSVVSSTCGTEAREALRMAARELAALTLYQQSSLTNKEGSDK